MAEHSRALSYPRFSIRPRGVERLIDGLIRPFSDLTAVETGPPVCRDRHDDMFLHCAVAAQARAIVTGDRDILAVGTAFRGIPILTVAKALQQFGD
jgi:putative PIN family toxin of toxin-antitoxin system